MIHSYPINRFANSFISLISIVAFNVGAWHGERVKKVIRLCGLYSALIGLVGTLIMGLFPVQLINAFAPSEEMFALGVPALIS